MPYVETAIDIAAPRRKIYELAKDMERYSEFMPDVEYVRIVRRDGDKTITRWKTLVEEAPIEWTEEDVFDDARTRIDYRLIDGDLDKFEGFWTFEERDGVTHVVLAVDYDFGVPTLAELIGPILQKKVEENSLMMLQALKAKSEGHEAGVG
jgi:ribosome-associated toxin RatA of RatAB toxin-antitoxin module